MISIIVPVFNSELFLKRCIESLRAQKYKNIEILLIDDGSEDSSGMICDEYEKKDKRIRVIHKKNGGPSEARNVGIENSKGVFITFVDADDYVYSDFLIDLYSDIKEKESDLVCSGYIDISNYGRYACTDFYRQGNRKKIVSDLLQGTGGVPWGKLYKTSIIKENNIRFDTRVIMSEDLLFLLDYIYYIKTYTYSDGKYYVYNRLSDDGISRNIDSKYLRSFEVFFEELNTKLLRAGYLKSEIDKIIYKRIENIIDELLISSDNLEEVFISLYDIPIFKSVIENSKGNTGIVEWVREKKWCKIYVYVKCKKIKKYISIKIKKSNEGRK